MKQQLRLLLVVILVMVIPPAVSISQPPNVPANPVDTPIDGGLTAMLAIGAGYGIKKIYNRNKKNKIQPGIEK